MYGADRAHSQASIAPWRRVLGHSEGSNVPSTGPPAQCCREGRRHGDKIAAGVSHSDIVSAADGLLIVDVFSCNLYKLSYWNLNIENTVVDAFLLRWQSLGLPGIPLQAEIFRWWPWRMVECQKGGVATQMFVLFSQWFQRIIGMNHFTAPMNSCSCDHFFCWGEGMARCPTDNGFTITQGSHCTSRVGFGTKPQYEDSGIGCYQAVVWVIQDP